MSILILTDGDGKYLDRRDLCVFYASGTGVKSAPKAGAGSGGAVLGRGVAGAGAAVEEDALHGGGRTVGEGTDGLAAKSRRRAKKGAGRVGILRACVCEIGTSLGPRMEVIAWAVNKETGRLPLGVRPLLS